MKKLLVILCTAMLSLVYLHHVSSKLIPGLPEDIDGYRKWTRLNKKIIKPTSADPHRGFKRVYVNKNKSELIDSNNNLIFPYPDGTIIVKEVRKTRKKKSKISLIAIMHKQAGNESTGGWDFIEYSRSSKKSFSPISFSKESCYSCHQGASDSDAVWTKFNNFKK